MKRLIPKWVVGDTTIIKTIWALKKTMMRLIPKWVVGDTAIISIIWALNKTMMRLIPKWVASHTAIITTISTADGLFRPVAVHSGYHSQLIAKPIFIILKECYVYIK